jgi:hypothetical protein
LKRSTPLAIQALPRTGRGWTDVKSFDDPDGRPWELVWMERSAT